MNVILFDIDGTLLVTNRAGSSAMHAALLEEFGIEHPAEVDFAGRTDRSIMGDFFRHHGLPADAATVERFISAYLRHLPLTLAARQGYVLPGVGELLAHAGERTDVAIGLVTGNLERGARHKLAHFDLERHFSFGGFGDRHLERNDVAREALAAAEHHAGRPLEAERVIVIGDTLLDIACARSIGARSVAVATGSHGYDALAEARPDVLLKDLSAFEFVLDMIQH